MSHNFLALQIQGRTHACRGKALTNFDVTLPPTESDLATQVFKEPSYSTFSAPLRWEAR